MNNSELEKKLKSARDPELGAEYREAFSQAVLDQLRSSRPRLAPARHLWRPRLVWGFATAAALLLAFALGHWHGRTAADGDVLADSRLIQETLAMFPNRVRAIVREGHGMRLVLSEQADVPVSPPIYVRICDGSDCSSLVTFSGQEIQIAGQRVTVLSDATDGIILEGNHFVWSSSGSGPMAPGLKVQARMIRTKTM